jgi:hypothetical protein
MQRLARDLTQPSGTTLGLIVGEQFVDEILCSSRHPMLAPFRTDRF